MFPIPQELPRSGKQNVFFGSSFERVRERMTEDRAVNPGPLGMSKRDLGREVFGFRSGRRDYTEFSPLYLLVFPCWSVTASEITALLAQSPCPSSHLYQHRTPGKHNLWLSEHSRPPALHPSPAGTQASCSAQIIRGAYSSSTPNVACVSRRLFEVVIFIPGTFKGRVIKCI